MLWVLIRGNSNEYSEHMFYGELTQMILQLDRVMRIWYLSPMRAAKVQASLRIRAVSPEPSDRKPDPWPL